MPAESIDVRVADSFSFNDNTLIPQVSNSAVLWIASGARMVTARKLDVSLAICIDEHAGRPFMVGRSSNLRR